MQQTPVAVPNTSLEAALHACSRGEAEQMSTRRRVAAPLESAIVFLGQGGSVDQAPGQNVVSVGQAEALLVFGVSAGFTGRGSEPEARARERQPRQLGHAGPGFIEHAEQPG